VRADLRRGLVIPEGVMGERVKRPPYGKGRAAACAPTWGESVSHERASGGGAPGPALQPARRGCRGAALTKRLSKAKTWLAPNL